MSGAIEAAERLRAAADSGDLDVVCRKRGIALLGLFGSAARPDPDRLIEPADLDVAVSFLAAADELGLIDDLTRLTSYDRIDLAVLDGANPVLRAEALVGVALYEHEPGVYATAQMAAMAERRDTEWLRKLDLDALAG